MTDYTNVLSLFKLDLGVTSTSRDPLYLKKIEASDKELKSKGISTLEEDAEDMILLLDYALWMYQKKGENVGLPANLQTRIRDRIVKNRSKFGDV